MNNPFVNSNTNKRYYTFDYYGKKTFGCKVYKVPLDAGFTCPNIDGKCGVGGCTYCSGRGSGDFAPSHLLSIEEQYEISRRQFENKWQGGKCIPYFQAHTNTYAPVGVLRPLYERALALPDAVGLDIATRADCLEDDVVELLFELAEKTHLTVELGLQTIHDETARRINRGHDFETFLRGYEKLKGLNVVIHLIDYLPGESYDMMMESAKAVAALRPHGVKLHLLYIMKGTAIEKEYREGGVYIPTMEEYVQTVCDQIEVMPSDTVIGRLTGDAPLETLVAPLWSRKKVVVLNEIDKELVKRGSFQGQFV